MKQKYIVDTNVFLTNSQCIFDFTEGNDVIIPLTVLDEIDNHKQKQGSVGVNARSTIRTLDRLREKGSLFSGVSPRGRKGEVFVRSYQKNVLPEDFDISDADNKIIAVAITAHKKTDDDIAVISRDLNLRVKCDSVGINTEDYDDAQAVDSTDKLFTGATRKCVSSEVINNLYRAINDDLYPDDIGMNESSLNPNQFVNLYSAEGNGSAFVRYLGEDRPFRHVKPDDYDNIWGKGIGPRNREQIYSFDLLNDDDVGIVSLIGPAGAGKTLCALASGLEQTVGRQSNYDKLVIVRPVEPVGRDLGYLPGSFEDKIHPWLKPVKDNLEEIVGDRTALEMYIDKGTVEIEALSYIRGRSISDAFVILDEAQNLSSHEVKTVITRIAEGSKIVLTGDIKQIDNAYIDETSNGLTHVAEKMKKYDIAGHCSLTKGERSSVASLAAEVL